MRLIVYFALLLLLVLPSCVEPKKEKVFQMESLSLPAGDNASLPFLFSNTGATLLSWVEQIDDSLAVLRYSKLVDNAWQKPSDIVNGTDWFVNWADFPVIAENNGQLFSHVLQKSSEEMYSYDVKLNLKSSNASEWNTGLPLHTDETPTEHGFVTAIPYQENSFFVTWLDGRNTEEKENQVGGAMTIRAAEVSINGEVKNETLLDLRTCDCCQTTAAITENGPVVLYRDRSENEIRDISIVRQIDGEWTNPVPIHNDNWKIKGCPVNGPKAVSFENVLAVTWFTGSNGSAAIKVAFSNDNGANFNAPIAVGSDKVLGRVDIVLLDKNTALVSHMESKDRTAQLKVVKINQSGETLKERVITEISSSRKTGFPQMELVDDKVFFAWTDLIDKKTTVETASISLESF